MEMYIDFYAVKLKLSEFPVSDDWLSGHIFVLFSLLCFNYEIALNTKISTTNNIIFRKLYRLSEGNCNLAEVGGGDSCFSHEFPSCGGLDVIVPLPPDQALNSFHSVLELVFEVDGLDFYFRLLLRRLSDYTLIFSQLSLWIESSV